MESTIVRQVITRLTLKKLKAHAKSGKPLTVSIGPVPNSRGDEEIPLSTKTIILDTVVHQEGWIDFLGVTQDTSTPITLTWSDSGANQNIIIEFNTHP